MRPQRGTDAHQTDGMAELVCSNSFRADDWEANAVGLLHAEMRQLGSLINLARPRGFHVSAAADEIFEVEEKLTGRCVCHGTAAQVHRWLREKPIGEQTR